MSVETVGQFKKVLDNYSGADWVKSEGTVEAKGNLGPIGLEDSLGDDLLPAAGLCDLVRGQCGTGASHGNRLQAR